MGDLEKTKINKGLLSTAQLEITETQSWFISVTEPGVVGMEKTC